MPLMPKRVKYRKNQRGSRKGFESRAHELPWDRVRSSTVACVEPREQ